MLSRRHRKLIVACEAVESRRYFQVAEVNGSSQGEEIRIRTNFSTIVVDIDGEFSQSYPRVIFDSVSIAAGGGADRIVIDSNEDVPVTISAGNGNDEIHLAETSKTLDDVTGGVTLLASSGSDRLFIYDDSSFASGTYLVDNRSVSRDGFDVVHNGVSSINLNSGGGVDTFNVRNTNGANLIIDGQGGQDLLNLNELGNGAAAVSFETTQDFARITSAPGGNLTLAGDAGLLLSTNLSNVEGNVAIGTGFIIETNSQGADGQGYWRERLKNGTTSATPSLTSSFANSSALNDAIGYAYAQDLAFTTLGGFALTAGDLVLRYTLKGDANLDQTVNFSDLVVLAQNYNGTSRDWRQGDFDLSRNVNFADLVALAQNYNQSVPAPASTLSIVERVAKQVLATETPKRRQVMSRPA